MDNKNYFLELKKIIELNSYTKNKKGVDKNSKIFSNWMHELSFSVEEFKRENIGNHLLFRSLKREGKKLLLLGHLDTVFPPNSFEKFDEDKEWIYGPGVCDMKGGNYIALQSLRNIKEKYNNIYNIDFLLVSDEETGSDDSKYVTMELAKEYDYCLVFEAAGKNGEVVVGRKGVGTFFIDIKGKAAHAGNSYTQGINANLEAARKIISLTELTDLSLGTTVNVGKMEGGIGANTISPNAKLSVEIRYTSADERDRVLKSLHEIVHNSSIIGIESSLSGGIQRDVMQHNDEKLEFLNTLEEVTQTKFLTENRGGVSDANIIASMGVVTLDGFGPFGDGDHTIHERANKKSFIERIELVTKIFEGFMDQKFNR